MWVWSMGQIAEMRYSSADGSARGDAGSALQAGQAMMDRALPDGALPRTLPYLLLSRDEAVPVQAALLPLQVLRCLPCSHLSAFFPCLLLLSNRAWSTSLLVLPVYASLLSRRSSIPSSAPIIPVFIFPILSFVVVFHQSLPISLWFNPFMPFADVLRLSSTVGAIRHVSGTVTGPLFFYFHPRGYELCI